MAVIQIKNLRLRTIIGIEEWERENKQDVIINVSIEYNAGDSIKSDQISDTVDYKIITKKIIKLVETSNFFLLEKLADKILKIVTESRKVLSATVKVDKPFALRFADSVSVELSS